MANWCEGSLKVRGTKKDITHFLKEVFIPIGYGGNEGTRTIDQTDCDITIESISPFYVKGTKRNFVENDLFFYFGNSTDDTYTCVIDGYKSAWGLDVVAMVKLSEDFNVDLKIYAFEQGQQFNHDLEIHKGKIVTNKVITFDDYDWECMMPTMGG